MKISFNLSDDTTVTNDTVKLTLHVSGTVGDRTRADIDKAVREAVAKLGVQPEKDWAYSGFHYNEGGLTFGITATGRIPAQQDEQLAQKAQNVSDNSVKIAVMGSDPSIPQHKVRDAESKLRLRLIELARAEAEALSATVSQIEFGAAASFNIAKHYSGNATYAMAMDSVGAPGGGGEIGHTEKVSLSAKVTVESR